MLALTQLLEATLNAAREGEPAAVLTAVDLLIEAEATLGEVVSLYAGQSPNWQDVATQVVLAKWCSQTEPNHINLGQINRWMMVRNAKEDPEVFAATYQSNPDVQRVVIEQAHTVMLHGRAEIDTSNPAIVHAGGLAKDACRIDLKRRVLAMFPDVTRTLQHTFSMVDIRTARHPDKMIRDILVSEGFRLTLTHEERLHNGATELSYFQTLAAPDWIAPPLHIDIRQDDRPPNLLAAIEENLARQTGSQLPHPMIPFTHPYRS